MKHVGMSATVDAAGNLRGFYPARTAAAPRLVIGSHLDTVPRAGAFDGILGVVLGIALIEELHGRRLRFGIEVIGFSEEEGVRFGFPFIGSRACAGTLDSSLLQRTDANGLTVAEAIRKFDLDPDRLREAEITGEVLGYLEFHIEQGPLLEQLALPLGIVEAIVGQSRFTLVFEGKANHAGTTPMPLRRDALAGAAEWIGRVERVAMAVPELLATVGRIEVLPGAGNVIAGEARASLDVRHRDDGIRSDVVARILRSAETIAARRGLRLRIEKHSEQSAVAMNPALQNALAHSVQFCGFPVHRMVSGAGHDAMILAERMPAAMLFLRCPGGISHHPDETVFPEDVAAAMKVGIAFLEELENGGI